MSEETREMVSKAYAKAVQGSGGCCSQSAGYGDALDQGVQSFGCGNPLAFAGVQPGETVVDLGSGPGLDLLIAAEKVGPEGRGDRCRHDRRDARQGSGEHEGPREHRAEEGHHRKAPAQGRIGGLDHLQLCHQPLARKGQGVRRDRPRLKPGGRFSISDICARDLPQWLKEHQLAYASCIAGAISEDEYVSGLKGAGLEANATDSIVYEPEQIRGLVEDDLKDMDLDVTALSGRYDELAGKVASVRFAGQKPGCCGPSCC